MKIESVRHGYLIATNGPDTMTAEYKRGFKLQDGYHPHWNITFNGQVVESVYGDREDVIAQMERLLALPFPSPIDVAQTNAMISAMGMVRGIVSIPLCDLMKQTAEETISILNRKLTSVWLRNIQCHAVGTSEDGQSVYIRICGTPCPMQKGCICRVPTNQEWDRLVGIGNKKDFQIYWKNMFSWTNDVTADADALSRTLRGYFTVHNYRHYSPSGRRPNLGFRPAFEPLSSVALKCRDGEQIVVGTLFMGGEPVPVPSRPTWDGDIAQYVPGATLEMREPLPDTKYQIRAIKAGNVLIADRNLLKNISWNDLHQQGFC